MQSRTITRSLTATPACATFAGPISNTVPAAIIAPPAGIGTAALRAEMIRRHRALRMVAAGAAPETSAAGNRSDSAPHQHFLRAQPTATCPPPPCFTFTIHAPPLPSRFPLFLLPLPSISSSSFLLPLPLLPLLPSPIPHSCASFPLPPLFVMLVAVHAEEWSCDKLARAKPGCARVLGKRC